MPDPTPAETIRLSIPSRLELLSFVDKVILEVCARMQFDEEATSAISMAVIEAGTNAIQHGHKKDASKVVDMEFVMHDDQLEVIVHDQGAGFDTGALQSDVTAPEHLFDARGRGIFIMRACMDRVEFDFFDGGTVCRLYKQRQTRAAAL
jgi:anti-sigma regulatory factor (Ser/Thr protein kinase)